MSPSSHNKKNNGTQVKPLFAFVSLAVVAGFIWGAVAMNVSTPSSANASSSKTEVESIVKDYIAGHGDELMASITNAQNRKQLDAMAKMIGGETPSKGPIDAPVTIIEFSDFQCPFCDRVQPTLTELRAKYGDKIRWVFKNLPLEFHPNARPAAYAALAANKQGKFWEYSQQLWANQANLSDKLYTDIATSLKLDMAKFNADRASDAVKAQVEADMKDAEAMGARGTPHFAIDGKPLSGALPVDAFSQIIDEELKGPQASK